MKNAKELIIILVTVFLFLYQKTREKTNPKTHIRVDNIENKSELSLIKPRSKFLIHITDKKLVKNAKTKESKLQIKKLL